MDGGSVGLMAAPNHRDEPSADHTGEAAGDQPNGVAAGAGTQTAPAEPTEPTEEAPPPEAPADDTLSDEGWTLTNLEVSEGALGDFEAVGRVTNETGQAAEGTIFSLSVLDADGGVIATLDASASNVDDGETVTAEFISSDPYQDGDWTYEFTVTGSS